MLHRLIIASTLALVTCPLSRAQDGSLAKPIETLVYPEGCSSTSEEGDHLLIRYNLKSAEDVDGWPLFSMNSWEQQYVQLGHQDSFKAFNTGLLGMCAGEKRRLTFPAADFDLSLASAAKSPVVVSEVELVTLTNEGDYHIFSLIDSGEVGKLMDMIDGHAGVNAVDKYGNSALMASVQAGPRMQMAVATLLNSWKPKCDVDFQKPSGHTALFYAVTQDDVHGSTIVKALLTRGADPNVALTHPDTAGWTPLHYACKFKNIKHVTMLLEYGANPLAESSAGLSVLDAAKDAPYSTRKKLAGLLNEALERIEAEEDESAIGAPGDEL